MEKLESVVVGVGTKQGTLEVLYSKIYKEKLPGNQDGEKGFYVIRPGIDPNSRESYALPFNWSDSEIDKAMKELAREFVCGGFFPSEVRDTVDDRYGRLTDEQKAQFLEHCKQETGNL